MAQFSRQRSLQAAFCGMLALAGGCMLMPERELVKFRTPAKRIAALERLAENVAEKTAGQQREVVATLTKQYQAEPDPLMREYIIRTLGAYPGSLLALDAALSDSDATVRVVAIEKISEHSGPEAVPLLVKALQNDSDVDVRLAAARGLGNFKQPAVVTALSTALNDPDPALQHRAMESLSAATGKDLGGDVEAWREFVKTGAPPEPKPVSLAEQISDLWIF